jgi:hypothetical protein
MKKYLLMLLLMTGCSQAEPQAPQVPQVPLPLEIGATNTPAPTPVPDPTLYFWMDNVITRRTVENCQYILYVKNGEEHYVHLGTCTNCQARMEKTLDEKFDRLYKMLDIKLKKIEASQEQIKDPSFRFSRYFSETCEQVTPRLFGEWLKTVDADTINFMISTIKEIDESGMNDSEGSDSESRRDLADMLYLTLLVYQWEKGKPYQVDDSNLDRVHLNVEYMYRLCSLIQFEYIVRYCGESKDRVLERDNEKYKGQLTIFD